MRKRFLLLSLLFVGVLFFFSCSDQSQELISVGRLPSGIYSSSGGMRMSISSGQVTLTLPTYSQSPLGPVVNTLTYTGSVTSAGPVIYSNPYRETTYQKMSFYFPSSSSGNSSSLSGTLIANPIQNYTSQLVDGVNSISIGVGTVFTLQTPFNASGLSLLDNTYWTRIS